MPDSDSHSDTARRRERMVAQQIEGRGVLDHQVLSAMREVPREAFVPDELAEFAYEDTPLPIAANQTISQPYIVAMMIEAAEVEPDDRVLDVGTGSGYAAAVLGRIARQVWTIERHPELAAESARVFERLGYDNIEQRSGDGTLGWAEAAPFDVILVAAGGPEAPRALLDQLAPGGRLVMPIGDEERHQHLVRIRRQDDDYIRENLGDVAFVPLIGAQGWAPKGTEPLAPWEEAPPAVSYRRDEVDAGHAIAARAEPLPQIGDDAFARLFDRLGDARVVLLGEATHGTSEFYRARAAITRRLIEEHGFDMVCIEADWPDAARIDRYVRLRESGTPEATSFARFPTWMWRNAEMRDFVDWLHRHNAAIDELSDRVSFHGLDLYSLHTSIASVLDYLDEVDPQAAAIARRRYGCLSPWERDPVAYGRAALSEGFESCRDAVAAMLRDLMARRVEYAEQDGENFLDAERNAALVAAAEEYYRTIYRGAAQSWNLRDEHMFETLVSVMNGRGADTKAVVWAHNSHVGNAAATEMGVVREELNIGQLCRERFGEDAALVGFGTDRGTVAAASDWDAPMEIMDVRPAREGSYEALCREAPTGTEDFLLDLRSEAGRELRESLLAPHLERAIGVIYRPERERLSHYFEASLPQQFDLWVWFENTAAVRPLAARELEGVPDTYPFAL